jgi:hypothetical protein
VPRFGLVGASYTDQALNADAQATINLYPEQIESGAGNAPIILLPTPGLASFATITPHPPLTVSFNNYNTTTSGGWVANQSTFTLTVTPTNSAGSGPIKVGDVGFLMLIAQGADAAFSVADAKGNIWAQLGSTQNPMVSPYTITYMYVFKAPMGTAIPVGQTLVITVTLGHTASVTNIPFPNFANCTGLHSATPISSVLQNDGSGANPLTGTITTAQPACLVSFVFDWPANPPALTLPTGWTDTQIANLTRSPQGWGAGYVVENTFGSYSDQWTAYATPSSSVKWTSTFVAFG